MAVIYKGTFLSSSSSVSCCQASVTSKLSTSKLLRLDYALRQTRLNSIIMKLVALTLALGLLSTSVLAADKHTPGDVCLEKNRGKATCTHDRTKVVSCLQAFVVNTTAAYKGLSMTDSGILRL